MAEWSLGVPSGVAEGDLAAHAEYDWTVNSCNIADEEVLRTLASMARFTPRITHRIDSLELVADRVSRSCPATALRPGVTVLPLGDPHVELRVFRPAPGLSGPAPVLAGRLL